MIFGIKVESEKSPRVNFHRVDLCYLGTTIFEFGVWSCTALAVSQLQDSQAQSFSSLETLQWQAMEDGRNKMVRCQPNTFKYTIGVMGGFCRE